MEWASSMAPPRWSPGPGSALKSGSSERARLIFTTPLREFHRSMLPTKSSGKSSLLSCSRNVILGCVAATTTSASSSSPPSSTTPLTRPSLCKIRSTGAFVLTSAPNSSAELLRASETAPIPPLGYPQELRPRPASPISWCINTYAVPGVAGPAHVPMMPSTAIAPFICGDSNQSSSRSQALIVMSLVSSPTNKAPIAPPPPPKPFPPLPVCLRVLAREPRERLVVFLGVYPCHGQGPPIRERVVRRSHRIDLVPVMLQAQLVDDAPGHQTHHVRVRGDVELRGFLPGRVGGGRPTDLVTGLEHHRPQPVAGEISPRGQPVVPPADDYGLVTAAHHPLLPQACDQY